MRTAAPFEVGITVAELATVLPFYERVLGLRVVGDLEVPAAKGAASGLSPGGYRIVRLETSSGDRLKLAQPRIAPTDVPCAGSAMERRGAAYVTFIVEDVDSLHRALVEAHATIRSRGKVEIRPGVWLLLVTDPEGNYLEFLQYDDLASYRGPAASRP